MSDNYVQQNNNTTATGSVSVTLTGVVAGNTLVAFAFDGTTTTPASHTVSDGQGSYTAQGSALTDSTNAVWGQAFTLVNANAGSHTATATFGGSDNAFLCLVEVGSTAGASAFSGANQAFQVTPAAGANTLDSGSVAVSAASTLIGFSTDTASITASDEPTAGTSPVAFTSRTSGTSNGSGAWRLESAGVASNADATAGPVTTSHNFMTFGVAILNASGAAVVEGLGGPGIFRITPPSWI